MSKIYDYEEYQNQRVKVTYTDKRKYREENIVGLYGQVIKTTSVSGVNGILYIVFVENIDTIYSKIFTKKHRFLLL